MSTADPSLDLLLQHLQSSAKNAEPYLWLADEHHNSALGVLAPYKEQLTLLSNRFDIAQQARQVGLSCLFSDWHLADDSMFARAYLRVCKEKPVNVHLLRLAFSRLCKGGQLLLSGQKNEGVKSIAKEAEAIFGQKCTLKKHGLAYFCELTQNRDTSAAQDLDEYHQVRPIGDWYGLSLQSKLGVYGWNKIDRGSELLISCARDYVLQHALPTESLLDIGCGYGFLSIAAKSIPCKRRVATDNNAAALICTTVNARENGLDIEVTAGDCADSIHETFDIVLCNPPFHKGFDTEASLTQRFVRAAANKTNGYGTAFFVVNSFIALESKVKGFFNHFETLSNNGQFKVIGLRH